MVREVERMVQWRLSWLSSNERETRWTHRLSSESPPHPRPLHPTPFSICDPGMSSPITVIEFKGALPAKRKAEYANSSPATRD